MTGAPPSPPADLVIVERFIEATRDSGYKSTPSAVAELVDNALDAGAARVHVRVAADHDDPDLPLTLSVQDDGHGMTPEVMQRALGFGGSTRFNQRGGLGRYGMGLPNSSVSQARRVTLYSWVEGGPVRRTWLDVDEVATGGVRAVPAPAEAQLPPQAPEPRGASGTLVVWTRCDRLDNKRPRTIARKLMIFLGRVYRHFIWRGVELLVNDERVVPVDPLYLAEDSRTQGGRPFGEPLEVELAATSGGSGVVTVRFTELPVARWHSLDNKEKRRRGVPGGAGISVVRGDREIDYGWLFVKKRKENYDDWWRCEVRFDPILDEHFGITHTKQQIRPSAELLEAVEFNMDAMAKMLNGRVRRAYLKAKGAGAPKKLPPSAPPPTNQAERGDAQGVTWEPLRPNSQIQYERTTNVTVSELRRATTKASSEAQHESERRIIERFVRSLFADLGLGLQ
ncbi:MAG: ATP-binding protein [Alphaproteobacteria bacterium]|nr:ATP-binding protein [Alphaproteobacteria bacterium]